MVGLLLPHRHNRPIRRMDRDINMPNGPIPQSHRVRIILRPGQIAKHLPQNLIRAPEAPAMVPRHIRRRLESRVLAIPDRRALHIHDRGVDLPNRLGFLAREPAVIRTPVQRSAVTVSSHTSPSEIHSPELRLSDILSPNMVRLWHEW